MNTVILFYSTNMAIWAADELKENNIKCKLIPVPRELSSDCGYCVSVSEDDKDKAEAIIKENDIEYDQLITIK